MKVKLKLMRRNARLISKRNKRMLRKIKSKKKQKRLLLKKHPLN